MPAQIEQDFARPAPSGDPRADEVARFRIIANRRAEAAEPRWAEDVRTRKPTIANGEGVVHGYHYDLETQRCLRLEPVGGRQGAFRAPHPRSRKTKPRRRAAHGRPGARAVAKEAASALSPAIREVSAGGEEEA